MLQHLHCHFVIGDHAVLQRVHCHHIAGCTSQHIVGGTAYLQNTAGGTVHSHDRRLTADNAASFNVNQHRGGS